MKIDHNLSAIITGGASGLGAATAARLSAKGVRVAIFDSNAEAGQKMANEINGLFIQTDVSNAQSVAESLAQARAQNGQEHICINCAGIAPAAKTVSRGTAHDPDLFTKTIAVNLIGSFNVASQCAAGMAEQDAINPDGERGVIIHTASVAAYDGQIGQTAYSASKAGIAGLILPMARDLADKGIRVMAIAPGIFGTPMVKAFPDEVQQALAAQIPFPSRLGEGDEYAHLVEHIIENAMLNGEVIRLDGAIRMGPR